MKPQIIIKSHYEWGTPCCDKLKDMIDRNMFQLGENINGIPLAKIVSFGEHSYPIRYCPFCKSEIFHEERK